MTTTLLLTPVQSQALVRLLAGQTVAAVARELKIDRSTIYDWRKSKPQFRQALDEGRALLEELTADALADLAATAIDTLRQLLTSIITPPSVRLRAAESVLRAVERQQRRESRQNPDPAPAAAAAASSPPVSPTPVPSSRKPGRNEPCPCGSLKKFKRCCGNPLAPSSGPSEPGGIPHNPTLSGTTGTGTGGGGGDAAAPPAPPLDQAA